MGVQWYLVEDKDPYSKLLKNIEFPYEISNFKRQKKTCVDKEDLLDFILCTPEVKEIKQILTAKIHPEFFISRDTIKIISHYSRYKRYGIDFLYPEGIGGIPTQVLDAFDLISNAVDKAEQERMKASEEKMKAKSK